MHLGEQLYHHATCKGLGSIARQTGYAVRILILKKETYSKKGHPPRTLYDMYTHVESDAIADIVDFIHLFIDCCCTGVYKLFQILEAKWVST